MKRKSTRLFSVLLISSLLFAIVLLLLNRFHPSPKEEILYQGVTYIRDVRNSPRSIIIHVITIDLHQPGIRIFITPGDPKADLPLTGRTTSEFLRDFGVQIAINGDGFKPWHSTTFWDYYPHEGDPVDVIGFASSDGIIYSQDSDKEPAIFFSRTNQARFNKSIGGNYNVISGNTMLVENGLPKRNLESTLAPRSAIALDRPNRHLILIVVDGRQPGYSDGVSLPELADILIFHGAYTAMNLDGGGSSTLVTEGDLGGGKILNSPINNGIPGRERVVGNHLGIYAKPLP